MKVLITPRGFANYGLQQIEYMQKHGITVHYNDTGKPYSTEEFRELASDSDAIIVGVDIIDQSLIDSCPKLKVICKFGVGTDNIDVDYAHKKGIHVGKTLGTNSIAVAEHVMALMYSEAKNIVENVCEVKDGMWNKPTGLELNGKNLGIIGFGAIGKHLAKFARGIGMNVSVYDSQAISDEAADEYKVNVCSFDNIIKNSDFISLHIPLLDATVDLISTPEFNEMKSTACLINSARGGIVNEVALYEALINKQIRSACFDVFSTEPPKNEDKLLELDNFYLTAHIGSRTVESEMRTCQKSTDIIMNYLLDDKVGVN